MAEIKYFIFIFSCSLTQYVLRLSKGFRDSAGIGVPRTRGGLPGILPKSIPAWNLPSLGAKGELG
jgi:hypothetical protein